MKHSQRMLVVPLALLLVLSVSCCTRTVPVSDQPDSVRRQIAVQIDRVAEGVEAALQTKRELFKDKLIDQPTSLELSKLLLAVAIADKAIDDRVKTYQTFDPAAKADILKLVNDLMSAANELAQKSVLSIPDKDKAAFTNVVALVNAAAVAITSLLQ